jgi:serine/threonine-protein kinase
MLRQACHSLAEAHAAGLVHRDVKPANLFVCRLGLDLDFVKVLDFGLVRLHGAVALGPEAVNADGGFTGTPGFMPPEVALAAPAIDGRADIYALGCVAYWLLTGRRVFEGDSAMQMVIDHVRKAPAPLSLVAPQPIPAALEQIVLRCLEKDPAHRPASAAVLSQALESLEIEGRWTEERAREWWHARDADRRAREVAAALQASPTAVTRSMPPIHFKALLGSGGVGARAARIAFR